MLREMQKRFNLPSEIIRENEALYHQIQALSEWPKDNKWEFILSSLA